MGGKPIGSNEIARYVKERGDWLIVTDYLDPSDSPAKRIADEIWDVSTADVDELARRCKTAGVDAIMTGVHEFNIEKTIQLCGILGLPCWCNRRQWDSFEDKPTFKRLCREHGIDVAREFDGNNASAVKFPVVVKPADGSGSRGFSRCDCVDDFGQAFDKAKKFSPTETVLVEEFIDGDAVIIHYTVHGGKAYFCGIADKLSKRMGDDGAPIMALQIAPSEYQEQYLAETDSKAKKLIESLGLREAPLWIEAFYHNGHFVFNEAGLRFGGSMTNYLVRALCGIDQMALMYSFATGESFDLPEITLRDDIRYAVFPTHLHSGCVESVSGLEELRNDSNFIVAVPVHGVGDEIADWGSAQQVFAYLHFCAPNASELVMSMKHAICTLSVNDSEGREMLCSLFDPANASSYPQFLVHDLELDRCHGYE
jgi:biotin carboxylase